MPKIKMPRSSPALDMTPMVDLAFLLVTFFMLVSQFRAEEPVIVDTPASNKEIQLPDKDIMLLTVDSAGRVFFSMDQKDIRIKMLTEMGKRYQIEFTEEENEKFGKLGSFGLPIQHLKEYLAVEGSDREKITRQFKGVPFDTTSALTNELFNWVDVGRRMSFDKYQKGMLRYAIKGDSDANYKKIKKIIAMFQSDAINVNRFNLVTSLEGVGE